MSIIILWSQCLVIFYFESILYCLAFFFSFVSIIRFEKKIPKSPMCNPFVSFCFSHQFDDTRNHVLLLCSLRTWTLDSTLSLVEKIYYLIAIVAIRFVWSLWYGNFLPLNKLSNFLALFWSNTTAVVFLVIL